MVDILMFYDYKLLLKMQKNTFVYHGFKSDC